MPASSPAAIARKRERDRQRSKTSESKVQAAAWYAANRDRVRAQQAFYAHGMTPADKQAMLNEQDSRCYLCGDQLDLDNAVIDHDHSCCAPTVTRKTVSCAFCRRGLACSPCNTIIGMARDDPERLRRIADSLAIVLPAVAERLARKPRQLSLEAAGRA